MRIRILMVGDNAEYMMPDTQMLKDRGFSVYTTGYDGVNDMVNEVHPSVVFINPDNPGLSSTRAYHDFLDNIQHASIPVIYTLSEDDVYLVNRKRTASRDKRNVICDNIIDSIKTSLLTDTTQRKKRVKLPDNYQQYPFYAFRA